MIDCGAAIEKARANVNAKSSISFFDDVFSANELNFNWFSRFSRSGIRKDSFYAAFGFEDDEAYTGKTDLSKLS